MTISKIGANQPITSQIVQYFPKEVIAEFSKHINTLGDIRTLSLLSKHFFLVVFNDNFPVWQPLLKSHFPSSFQMGPPGPMPMILYKSLKMIDNNMRIGTYQVRTIAAHQDRIDCLEIKDGMLFSGSADGTIKIWNIASGQELHCLESHQDGINCLRVQDETVA